MTVEYSSQGKSQRRPFIRFESRETDVLTPRPKNPLIERCLKQLVKRGLFGRPYVKDFLYDLKRRNCRPNTLRSYFTTLTVFLSYLKERGRTYLETITRDDLSGFIEHEQDRGMQPKTVSTRLRLLYAFVSYLVDREVVHPDLLKRKLRVKVPEALPRAIDPEDVQQFLAVIEKPRDRALVMLMLRCGLRVEEVARLKLAALDLRRSQAFVHQGKGAKDRVVYLSDDDYEALVRYLRVRPASRIKEVFLVDKGRCRGKAISVRGIQKRLEHYARQARLKV